MNSSPPDIHILLVDYPQARQATLRLLKQHSDLIVIGQADTYEDVFTQCINIMPDIILIEINIISSILCEFLAHVRVRYPRAQILVLTTCDSVSRVRDSIANGVLGYLLKGETPERIVEALRAIYIGNACFSRPIARSLAQGTRTNKDIKVHLTERERQLLLLIANGCTTSKIADELYLGPQTIRNYLRGRFITLRCALSL